MFLEGLAKFGSELAGNMLTASNSASLSRRNMEFSDQLQRAYTQDQYDLQKKGLIKAGYNPLLALGSSASQEALNVGTNTGGHVEGIDLFNMAQTSKLNASTIKKNDVDNENNTNLTGTTIREKIANIDNQTRTVNANIDNQTRITNADIGLKTAQTSQLQAEHLYTLAKLDMLSKQLKNYGADRMHNLIDKHIESGSRLISSIGDLIPGVKVIKGKTTFPNGNTLTHENKISEGKSFGFLRRLWQKK